ncbi:hypothetical protein [Microbacterium sp. CGR1]|uniref:hypothetical protein n=1 Tax=Microbacterium sp. CGR1 TaxID=1696072 RepID=UPI003DA5F1D7
MSMAARPSAPTSAWSRLRESGFPHAPLAAIVVIALQCVHGLADEFVYDAAQYWAGSVALVSGGDAAVAGVLQMRGALTSVIYVPPALLSALFGPASASWTVLAWNSLLAVFLCVFLLPRIAAIIARGPSSPLRVWVSALAGGVIVSGFSRFPLLDVWAVALALLGLYGLATGTRWWIAGLSGFALMFAANVRPAYLAPVLIAAAVLIFVRPKVVPWAIPGAALGLIPQLLLNVTVMGAWSVVPIGTSALMNVQATYATFATRYDTVLTPGHFPGQFYCDPGYAALQLGDEKPTSAPGVLLSAVRNLPDSLSFFSGKAAASLHWSFATPYEHPPGPGTSLMAFLVIGIAASGLVALFWLTTRSWRERTPRLVSLSLVGFWAGAVGTLVLSTPETRFAIPVVLIGLIGVIAAIPSPLRFTRPRPGTVIAIAIALVLAVALFALGKSVVGYPMPPGNMIITSLETCAAMLR